MKTAEKNKQSTFSALIADSELKKETIQVGDHSVTIREMTGRERFALGEKSDDPKWDVLCWVANLGLVDPRPANEDELEKLKPTWVVQIANAVMALSGMASDATDEAENESASVTDIGGS